MCAHYIFPPFRFDAASGELWEGGERVVLRPKTGAMLGYLVECRGQVVTRDELRQAIWPRSHGSEQAPKQCIRELRLLLRDPAASPRFIETVGRRGYRFIGRIALEDKFRATTDEIAATAVPGRVCVGRESELATLQTCLEHVRRGERRVVFVTGEAGIGKTTLIDTFVEDLAGQHLWVARGQ